MTDAVFPDCGKVYAKAVFLSLGALASKGSPLAQVIAGKLQGRILKKGCQERVSGWPERYDFATSTDR